MNEEVKHCPFCGYDHMEGEPVSHEDIFFFLECPRCGARGANAIHEENAVDRWNRRVSEMSEGLKHCPFCGAEAEVHKNVFAEGTVYTVECISCSCGLDWFDTEEEAIKAWNRRV